MRVGNQLPPLTQARAEARLRYWQRTLGLLDWTLTIVMTKGVLMGEGTLGRCFTHHTKRRARIDILDPVDFVAQSGWFNGVYDWEETIVHECLHCTIHDVIDPWPGEQDPKGKAAERAIDALARAFVALDRAKRLDTAQTSRLR